MAMVAERILPMLNIQIRMETETLSYLVFCSC